MKKKLIKWFLAVGVVLAVLMAGNAWADGRGKGHHGGHGYYKGPKHGHHVRHCGPPPVVYHHVRPRVQHHVHHYYVPAPPVQHYTYYVPAPAPVYMAPAPVYVAPPPPPRFAFSATINEPGFSLGIAAGR
jgi:hypothetical protein